MTTVTPYPITEGGQPTFNSVSGTDYIQIDPLTFIYFYNSSATDDVIVVSASEADEEGSYGCYACTLAAGSDLVIGPVDVDLYAPTLVVIHRCHGDILSGGVVMAVVTTAPHIEITLVTATGTGKAKTPKIQEAVHILPGLGIGNSVLTGIMNDTATLVGAEPITR